ncbi:hypothetical protein [Photobacterium kishitanii]|uniref:Uncharacterized protein n=1 Tax=Photobacterium kishitanii TaxID=318456 RepID=A0A2T3KJX6_9GAMM|nr:hypothetical protein [Photobacterium kishitanii]PSU99767.1 hypothetical protein C9J27_09070 [Photobacterium kishitanii]
MSFQTFIKSTKAIISLGASTNASCRKEIIDVVGKLSEELVRALDLADSYLVGAKFSIDDNELARYLADIDGTLMNSFKEHHICAGLYHLADKFEQVFNPTRFSVSLSNYQELPKLINELKNGEQMIIDDLQDLSHELRNYSNNLNSLASSRDDVLNAVEYHRVQLSKYRKQVKTQSRNIIKKL